MKYPQTREPATLQSSDEDDSPRLTSVRALVYLVSKLTPGGVIGYMLIVPLIEQSGVNAWWGVLVFAVFLIGVNVFVLQSLTTRLERLDLALWRLTHDYPVTALNVSRGEMLEPLVRQLNRLIEERATLKTMRGKLYEQISETAAQEERNRLARDLHDSIKQQVFSMSISAAAAHVHLDTDPVQARAALLDVRQSAQEAMVEMRALLQQLAPAPLEKSGLVDALREQVEAFSYRTGAKISTEFGQLPDNTLFPIGAQEAVFRIAQEALSNIARHARAGHVRLSLQQTDDSTVTLYLNDDGQGFDMAQTVSGMGLSNIRARGEAMNAVVDIRSTPGTGTTLEVRLPLMTSALVSEGDLKMQQQRQALFDGFVYWYRVFVVGVCAFMIALPLLTNNRLARGEELDPIDTVLVVMLVVVGAVFVGALGAMGVGVVRTQTARNALLVTAGEGSTLAYRERRYTYLGYTLIGIVGLWFFPLLWINNTSPALLAPITALMSTVFLLVAYYMSYRMYDRELQQMPEDEREKEIITGTRQVQSAWGSLIGLLVVLVVTDVFRNGLAFFPRTNDEWVTTSMILIFILLLFNQVIQLWYYRQEKKRLKKGEMV